MKQILLPTDFSENSWNAIKYAVQLFKNEVCTFHLLNTFTPVVYHVEYVRIQPAQFGLGDAVRDTSVKNLNKFISKIKTENNNPNHKFEAYAKFDTLIGGIREVVETKEIELIIMGTQGATGAKEVLFGSSTVHVFNNVKCAVLAVPSNFSYEAPHEILFPTDLKVDFNDEKLNILKHIVSGNKARLNAMHVSTGYELSKSQKENKAKLEVLFGTSAFRFHNVKSMEITEAINRFQVKNKINLLAIINNKHSFFENLFFKNKVNQIGFHLKVPFLVIPNKV